jgi:predicted dehydrogenase
MVALGPDFPRRVTCIGTNSIFPKVEVPDTVSILAEFPDGHTMIMVGSVANEQGLRDMIRGQKGTVYVAGGSQVVILPERQYADEFEPHTEEVPGPCESILEHQRNFFDCIRSGKVPNCNVDLAAKAQVVISLAEMSCKQSKMMSFDPEKLMITG